MYTVDVEQFSGPYDLLLQLIEKRDLAITDVSLSAVTEQFLDYLENSSIDSQELVDFLVVASKLLYLKSKALLPVDPEPEEDADTLEQHLKIYQAFVQAAEKIDVKWYDAARSFKGTKIVQQPDVTFRQPIGLTDEQMNAAMFQVINRLKPVVKLPKALLERTVSLNERITQMKDLLKRQKRVQFGHVIKSSENKLDIIVSFLAVLELANQRKVSFHQSDHFDDILITHH
jgi:segregation and condensation protein A